MGKQRFNFDEEFKKLKSFPFLSPKSFDNWALYFTSLPPAEQERLRKLNPNVDLESDDVTFVITDDDFYNLKNMARQSDIADVIDSDIKGISDKLLNEAMNQAAQPVSKKDDMKLYHMWLRIPPTQMPQLQLLRFWELFSFCLSRKTKREVFTPLFEELKEDYLLAKKFRTAWARRWLKFCFTLKTILMVCGCLRVTISSKLAKLLLSFIPESVRRFFSS